MITKSKSLFIASILALNVSAAYASEVNVYIGIPGTPGEHHKVTCRKDISWEDFQEQVLKETGIALSKDSLFVQGGGNHFTFRQMAFKSVVEKGLLSDAVIYQ